MQVRSYSAKLINRNLYKIYFIFSAPSCDSLLVALIDHEHLQEIRIHDSHMSVSTNCIALLGTAKWWKRLRKLEMINIINGETGPLTDTKHCDSALAALQNSKFLQHFMFEFKEDSVIAKNKLMAIAVSCPNLRIAMVSYHISCDDYIQILKAVDHSLEVIMLYSNVESDEFFSHLGRCQNLGILSLSLHKPGMTLNKL